MVAQPEASAADAVACGETVEDRDAEVEAEAEAAVVANLVGEGRVGLVVDVIKGIVVAGAEGEAGVEGALGHAHLLLAALEAKLLGADGGPRGEGGAIDIVGATRQ